MSAPSIRHRPPLYTHARCYNYRPGRLRVVELGIVLGFLSERELTFVNTSRAWPRAVGLHEGQHPSALHITYVGDDPQNPI